MFCFCRSPGREQNTFSESAGRMRSEYVSGTGAYVDGSKSFSMQFEKQPRSLEYRDAFEACPNFPS